MKLGQIISVFPFGLHSVRAGEITYMLSSKYSA
jgi:hypothetical protein